MKLSDIQLKRAILRLIGDAIDEQTLYPQEDNDHNSFVEMAEGVLHYAGDCGDRYFRLDLVETTEDHYFDSLNAEDWHG